MVKPLMTLMLAPLLLIGLLAVDHTARLGVVEDLTRAGAFRGGRHLLAAIDSDGRLGAGALATAREHAALSLWPMVRPGGPRASFTDGRGADAGWLADAAGLTLDADVEDALGRTHLEAYVGRPGAWRAIGGGGELPPGEVLRVRVCHLHSLRPDPAAWGFRWSPERFSQAELDQAAPAVEVCGQALLPVGGVG